MNKRTKYTSGKRTMVWMAGMLLSAQVFAQDLTVKGHVKDETGEPVIGANILIKGTTEGTISDLDGNFILPGVNPGDNPCHLFCRLSASGNTSSPDSSDPA